MSVGLLPSAKHKQDVHVAWRNTRNTAGLANGFRVDAGQFLAGFGAQRIDGRVVEFALNLDVFQAVQFVGNQSC